MDLEATVTDHDVLVVCHLPLRDVEGRRDVKRSCLGAVKGSLAPI